VRKVVDCEGEFVSVRGDVVSVDDRYAGVGHQSPQRTHRAGVEQMLDLLTRVPHVRESGQIAADLLYGRSCRAGSGGHLAQRLAGSPDQQ